MKRIHAFGKQIGILAIAGLFALSCSNDNDDPQVPEQQLTAEEINSIMDSEETSGVVDDILAEIYANDSKTAKYPATAARKGNECYVAEYTETGYVVTFNNCVLNGTDNVNGTLEVTYSQDANSAAFTATYVDFYVGQHLVNGTRSFAMSGNQEKNEMSFTVTSEMEVQFANGDVVTENGYKTITITAGDSLETTYMTISGAWRVTMNDHEYSISSENGVRGNFACQWLNEGEMIVNKNGLQVTVDFGDGSCDNKCTVIYPNGATEEHELED